MNNATTTTVPNTTASSETELNIPAITAELKAVIADRYKFTQEELISLGEKTIPALETLYAQTEDEITVGHIETAQSAIEYALDSLKPTSTIPARPLVPVLFLALDAIEAVEEENEID